MNKKRLMCAVLGGVIVFVWALASWMVLPWHKMAMHKFTNEQDVAHVIQKNAPVSGVYVIPSKMMHDGKSDGKKKMESMPFVYANVKLEGMDWKSMTPFVRSLIMQIVAAYLILWLLGHAKGLSHWKQVSFVTMVGLIAGLLGEFPAWNWMGFPLMNTLACVVDLVIGWFLAGLAMSKCLKKE